MRISRVSGIIGLILVAIMLTGGAGAHVYNPDKVECHDQDEVECRKLDGISETTVEWGDYIDVYVEHLNTTYTIEVNDFHILDVTVDIDETKADPCGDRTCSVAPDAKLVNLKIYKNQTLIGSYPFRESLDCLKSFYTSEGGWDQGGVIWNDENEFFVGVTEITVDFASDDCFCTDPKDEHAKIAYATIKPPELESSVKLYSSSPDESGKPEVLPSEDGSSIVRSNSVFKAEIKVKNSEKMPAYHVDASVSVKPVEMINGEYPPDCALQNIYTGVVGDDNRKWVGTTLPIDVRSASTTDELDGSRGTSEVTYTVHFKAPSLPDRTKYEIKIDLTYEDFKERRYQYTDNSTYIEVLPVIEVKKSIGTEDYAVVASEAAKAYTGETTYTIYADCEPYVFFTVINWGNYTIPLLTLSDSPADTWHKPATTDFDVWKCALPADMLKVPEMESDRWSWDFSLEPGGVMTCAYPVSLLKPGTYKLGSATVNWTEDGYNYSMVSHPQPVQVHGPYIEVTKTVDPTSITQNDTAKVTVTVKNTGDRAASITIMDQLPLKSVLVSKPVSRGMVIDEGNETFFLKRVLKSGAEETFDYTIDPSRTVMLPPAVVEFVDITTYEGISISDMPILTVEGTEAIGAAAAGAKATSESEGVSGSGLAAAEAEAAATLNTPVRKEPGFTGVFAVLACLAAVLIGRHRR